MYIYVNSFIKTAYIAFQGSLFLDFDQNLHKQALYVRSYMIKDICLLCIVDREIFTGT